jgi:hypothetical protein
MKGIALEEDSPFRLAALINAMRKTRKGRQHAQKGKARRVQQMTKLRQKAVRRTALSSLPSPSGGRV